MQIRHFQRTEAKMLDVLLKFFSSWKSANASFEGGWGNDWIKRKAIFDINVTSLTRERLGTFCALSMLN